MVNNFSIEAGSFGFDFQTGQIGHSVAYNSPATATFLRSCVAQALSRRVGSRHSLHASAFCCECNGDLICFRTTEHSITKNDQTSFNVNEYLNSACTACVFFLIFHLATRVRSSASEALPLLLECASLRGDEYVAQIWSFITPNLLTAIKEEPDKDVVAILMESLAKVKELFLIFRTTHSKHLWSWSSLKIANPNLVRVLCVQFSDFIFSTEFMF